MKQIETEYGENGERNVKYDAGVASPRNWKDKMNMKVL